MLYNKEELQRKDLGFLTTALKRYYHKYNNEIKKFKKLKTHEKDFFFSNLSVLQGEKECVPLNLNVKFSSNLEYYSYLEKKGLLKYSFDLYTIPEAKEYLFYRLILTYFKNLYFQSPVKGPYGNLTSAEIKRDRKFIEKNLKCWIEKLKSNSGHYIPFILKEYNNKMKILNDLKLEQNISQVEYLYKVRELQLVSFHIYYLVKFWFENYKSNYHKFTICGIEFVFDVFSYVHILSRHYMPSINNYLIDVTFNTELDLLDVRNIPYSIDNLLRHYSYIFPINIDDEYILLEFRNEIYILWIDYRILSHWGFKDRVMHVRTFYKCGNNDKRKILGKRKIISYLKYIYFFG